MARIKLKYKQAKDYEKKRIIKIIRDKNKIYKDDDIVEVVVEDK